MPRSANGWSIARLGEPATAIRSTWSMVANWTNPGRAQGHRTGERDHPIRGSDFHLGDRRRGRGRLAEAALDADAGRADHADVDMQPFHLVHRPVTLLGPGDRRDRAADVVDLDPAGPGEHDRRVQ